MSSAPAFWYKQSPVAWLLLPVTLLFCLLGFIRRGMYRMRLLRRYRADVPVVIVGNIAVGGTGKTPLIIELCRLLKDKGFHPGVISRGYGGSETGPTRVSPEETAAKVGDEPLLIAQRTACPVVVAADRPAAAKMITDDFDIDVILSDDGLQHYALDRQLEIVVVDSTLKHGNGFCLPSGPLREPVSRLNSVDFVVFNNSRSDTDDAPGFKLRFTSVMNLATQQQMELDEFFGRQVHAVAGIGRPQRFFEQLRHQGVKVIEHAFSDHHAFEQADICFDDDRPILMTEKDAVKCKQFDDATLSQRSWVVPVNAVLDAPLRDELIDRIALLINE